MFAYILLLYSHLLLFVQLRACASQGLLYELLVQTTLNLCALVLFIHCGCHGLCVCGGGVMW